MTNQTSGWFSPTTDLRELWGELAAEVGKLSAAHSMMTRTLQRVSIVMGEFFDVMHATSEETDTPS